MMSVLASTSEEVVEKRKRGGVGVANASFSENDLSFEKEEREGMEWIERERI